MLAYLTAERRFLEFNKGDWMILLGGLPLVVLAAYLFT